MKLNDCGCFYIATHLDDSQVGAHHPHLVSQLGLAGGDSGLIWFEISRVWHRSCDALALLGQ